MKNTEEMTEFEKNFTLTVESVKKLVSNLDDEKETLSYSWGKKKEYSFGGWNFSLEERHGGREGAGEEHWVVFYAKKGEEKRYFMVPGWYQSYNGSELEWSDLYEVEPYQKTVTDWKKK